MLNTISCSEAEDELLSEETVSAGQTVGGRRHPVVNHCNDHDVGFFFFFFHESILYFSCFCFSSSWFHHFYWFLLSITASNNQTVVGVTSWSGLSCCFLLVMWPLFTHYTNLFASVTSSKTHFPVLCSFSCLKSFEPDVTIIWSLIKTTDNKLYVKHFELQLHPWDDRKWSILISNDL